MDHTSRLDNLIRLLENKNPLIQKEAVKNIVDIGCNYPVNVPSLIGKLDQYLLQSTVWSARINASKIICQILKEHPIDVGKNGADEDGDDVKTDFVNNPENYHLSFVGNYASLSQFQLSKLLNAGIFLLGKKVLPNEPSTSGASGTTPDTAYQRSAIDRQLGLHPQVGLSSREWFSDEDLTCRSESVDDGHHYIPSVKRSKMDSSSDSPGLPSLVELEMNDVLKHKTTPSLARIYAAYLCQKLRSPSWEERHGASLGILATLMSPVKTHIPSIDMEGIIVELLIVMALDRFNDFVNGEATAPVRETCAQAIAFCVYYNVNLTNQPILSKIILEFLGKVEDWECRQSALMMLKYILAVQSTKKENLEKDTFMDTFGPSLLSALNDSSISIQVAQTLLPIADTILQKWPVNVLGETIWRQLSNWSNSDEWNCMHGLLRLLSQIIAKTTAQPITTLQLSLLISLLDNMDIQIRREGYECIKAAFLGSGDFDDPAVDGTWPDDLVQTVFRALFRRIALEPFLSPVRNSIVNDWNLFLTKIGYQRLISLVCPFVGVWLGSMLVSDSKPVTDRSLLSLNIVDDNHSDPSVNHQQNGKPVPLYLGGDEMMSLKDYERFGPVASIKVSAAKVLALTLDQIMLCNMPLQDGQSPAQSANFLLHLHLESDSLIRKSMVAMILCEWAKLSPRNGNNLSGDIIQLLETSLKSPPIFYEETGNRLANANKLSAQFIKLMARTNPKLPSGSDLEKDLTSNANNLFRYCLTAYEDTLELIGAHERETGRPYSGLKELRKAWDNLQPELSHLAGDITTAHRRILAWVASATVSWKHLPEKFNPIVKPLMDSVKVEEDSVSVLPSVRLGLCKLLALTFDKTPSPNTKILKNLVTFALSDTSTTPDYKEWNGSSKSIVSLRKLHQTNDSSLILRQNSTPPKLNSQSSINNGVPNSSTSTSDTSRLSRNASKTLEQIGQEFKGILPGRLHWLWSHITGIQQTAGSTNDDNNKEIDEDSGATLISQFRTLQILWSKMSVEEREILLKECQLLQILFRTLFNVNPAVRSISADLLVELASLDIGLILNAWLPNYDNKKEEKEEWERLGCMELFFLLFKRLDTKLIGCLTLLAPYVLQMMSDSLPDVRQLAGVVFAQAISLLPLEKEESEIANVTPLCDEIMKKRAENKQFLSLLTAPTKLSKLSIPIKLQNVQLRPYQQEGITWMWFLNEYHLHGILCDDMGLGKTLQSLVVLASSHYKKSPKNPSLIICPKTLVSHWYHEIHMYLGSDQTAVLKPCILNSTADLNSDLFNVFITSYDYAKKSDSACLSRKWHYCVLDEGHIIKNPKTQMFKSISLITAQHRIILSGKPVQNSVLELWALFEFLMPGYLGTHQFFHTQFIRPISKAKKEAAVSQDQSQAGSGGNQLLSLSGQSGEGVEAEQAAPKSPAELALNKLHKLVLPFILRRTKVDVLKDLPPKVIQDRYCKLSRAQEILYCDLNERVVEDSLLEDKKQRRMNAFQVLAFLRKLCDHPALVLSPEHHLFSTITSEWKNLKSLELSGKMIGLRELLFECSIGHQSNVEQNGEESIDGTEGMSNHRALIFCQFKATINLIESYLSDGQLGKGITWLRLDGTTPPNSRHNIANQFNSDPTIDLLLLTTQVGGLGLNLTGADVVIFVDHDWNPSKDLQAMDRAHRLGQHRTVNVYRLITAGTLEEKIMRLQRFKQHTADVIIGVENKSIMSMATSQLLELLSLDKQQDQQPPASSENGDVISQSLESVKSGGDLKALSSQAHSSDNVNVAELWDQSQNEYEQSFDVSAFVHSLNHS